MKTDKEYLTQLVLFELSGKIQEDEKTELSRMIHEDQDAAELYAQLHASLQQNPGTYQDPDELWRAIKHRKQRLSIANSIKGLVVVFLVAVSGLIFVKPKLAEQKQLATDSRHIKLQLSGGQIIDLNDQQGDVKSGSVVLNNHNKQLKVTHSASHAQSATITVPAGKDYLVHLPDGSTVQLNAESRLVFPLAFAGNIREITMEGEAYVKVVPVANKPFLVHIPGATVQVLGTEFNVNTYDTNMIRVALVAGGVKVNSRQYTTILKPGYESLLNKEKDIQVYKFDSDDVLAWRQGIHLFKNASVSEIALLIHRFYGLNVQLDVQPEHVKKFTGSIDRNKPAGHFLDGLRFSAYLDYHFDKDSTLHLLPVGSRG